MPISASITMDSDLLRIQSLKSYGRSSNFSSASYQIYAFKEINFLSLSLLNAKKYWDNDKMAITISFS